MSTTDPFASETWRFSWKLRATLFLAITSLCAAQSEGGPPLADWKVSKDRGQLRLGELVAMQAQRVQQADPAGDLMNARRQAFYTALLGQGLTVSAARTLLEERLAEKVASIDRICGPTNVQNQRLQLAGRGDIKRFFDRIDSLRSQFEQRPDTDDENDRAWAERLKAEALALRRALNSGVFEEGSLFAKTLKKTLTADQVAAYNKAPPMPPAIGVIRWIDPIGGKVWIAIGEGDEVKPRTTYHIRKKPRAQQMPGKPDSAPGEDAISGTIEVTRALGENLSEARIVAQDIAHPIAKGDTIVLRRPGVR